MLKKTLKFIENNTLLRPNDKILVACSGGPDSIALGHILLNLGYSIALAHVNYGFRGTNALRDAALVEQYAALWRIPVFLLSPEDHHLNTQLEGNLQNEARKVRYQWFERLCKKHGYRWIATGHHWEDQLETVLLRLFRGSALHGLTGISPMRDNIVRPLLFATKDDLIAYLSKNKIAFRQDASNRDVKYKRNALRHQVLPALKKVFPDLYPSTKATWKHLCRQDIVLSRLVDDFITKYHDKGEEVYRFPKDIIEQNGRALWEEILFRFGFAYHLLPVLSDFEALKAGQQYESERHLLHIERLHFVISRRPSDLAPLEPISVPETGRYVSSWGTLTVTKHSKSPTDDDSNNICIPAGWVHFPLTLRQWKPGDRFQPAGMKGHSKTVKKFLTDIKYPMSKKRRVPVLCDANGDIVWLPGLRVDHRFFTSKDYPEACLSFNWTNNREATE